MHYFSNSWGRQRFSHDWNLPVLLKTAARFLLGNFPIYYLEVWIVFIFKKKNSKLYNIRYHDIFLKDFDIIFYIVKNNSISLYQVNVFCK